MPLSQMPCPLCRWLFAFLTQMPLSNCHLGQMPFSDICRCPFAFLGHMPLRISPLIEYDLCLVTFAFLRQLPSQTNICHLTLLPFVTIAFLTLSHSNPFAILEPLPTETFAFWGPLPFWDICRSATFAILGHLPPCNPWKSWDLCLSRTFAFPRPLPLSDSCH